MNDWTCDYCKSLHPSEKYSCCNCGAPREQEKIDPRVYSAMFDYQRHTIGRMIQLTGVTIP